MPTYDYLCEECGPFEAIKRMSERDQPASCPVCGIAAKRVLSAPRLAEMEKSRRIAMETNERSRHEPKRSHGSGCSCCKPSTPKAGPKSFVGRRPWMISH
ncbi:MAG: hypothetical protein B7Z81_08075 [Acidocella sp. 20-61-6]|nr:MAG: hypothetical protein B7Z81_08075 [Acidocella sp. 20-61-6]